MRLLVLGQVALHGSQGIRQPEQGRASGPVAPHATHAIVSTRRVCLGHLIVTCEERCTQYLGVWHPWYSWCSTVLHSSSTVGVEMYPTFIQSPGARHEAKIGGHRNRLGPTSRLLSLPPSPPWRPRPQHSTKQTTA